MFLGKVSAVFWSCLWWECQCFLLLVIWIITYQQRWRKGSRTVPGSSRHVYRIQLGYLPLRNDYQVLCFLFFMSSTIENLDVTSKKPHGQMSFEVYILQVNRHQDIFCAEVKLPIYSFYNFQKNAWQVSPMTLAK